MNDEDKMLFYIDLCGRIPFNVRGSVVHYDEETKEPCDVLGTCKGITYQKYVEFFYDEDEEEDEGAFNRFDFEKFTPYLRPMSDMTSVERVKMQELRLKQQITGDLSFVRDFLNSIHVDYRGLIEKGLAKGVTRDFYNL